MCCRRSARAARWCASTRRPSTRSRPSLVAGGVRADAADAYARLSLGDAGRARALAEPEGGELRDTRGRARAAGARRRGGRGGAVGRAARRRSGRAVSACGSSSRSAQAAELELLPSRERKRAETEWGERVRRVRRRVETGALELALDLVEAWLLDLAALAFGALDLVRNSRPARRSARPTRASAVAVTRSRCGGRSSWSRTRASASS